MLANKGNKKSENGRSAIKKKYGDKDKNEKKEWINKQRKLKRQNKKTKRE